MFLCCWCKHVLNSIQERCQEFLTVALNSHVGWLPIILLEGIDKLSRVVSVAIRHLQEPKHSLELN